MDNMNINSEKLLLSGLIRHPQEFYNFCQYLDENHFNSDATRITWLSLYDLLMRQEVKSISKSKLVATARTLGQLNYLAVTNNGVWIDELFTENVSIPELEQNFLEVKRQSLIAGYITATDEIRKYLKNTTDPLSKIIGNVEDTLVSKVNLLDKGEHAVISLVKDAKKQITELADDPGHIGLDLGFPLLQNAIGQFRNGSLSLFVASTKQGKSIWGLVLGLLAARKYNIPVLILDSELNKNDQLIRAVGHLAQVPFDIIETGIWRLSEAELRKQGINDQAELDKIAIYRNRLNDDHFWNIVEKLPIQYVSISGMSVEDTIPHIRRWLLTKVKPDASTKIPQCLIIYDYIKLANREEIRGMAEWQAHGLNVASLHGVAQKYNIPIVAFGQTNNETDNGIHAVAGGKRISENVTSITYFKRKTDEERSIDSIGTHYWKNWGARYGKGTPGGHINFDADLGIGYFTELGIGSLYVPPTNNNTNQDDS